MNGYDDRRTITLEGMKPDESRVNIDNTNDKSFLSLDRSRLLNRTMILTIPV